MASNARYALCVYHSANGTHTGTIISKPHVCLPMALTDRDDDSLRDGSGMALGLILGVAIGVTMDQLAIGIALGIVFGVALEAGWT